jgi:glycosyltransferase involved in cell wall biosynthesis
MKVLHLSDCCSGGAYSAMRYTVSLLNKMKLGSHDIIINSNINKFIAGIHSIFFPFSPFMMIKFYKIFKKEKPDIVHFHKMNTITFSVVMLAKYMGIKTIMHIYDYWILCPRDNMYTYKHKACQFNSYWNCIACYKPKNKPYWRAINILFLFRIFIIGACIQYVDRFIVLSHHSKQMLTKRGFNHDYISVIPQWVDNDALISKSKSSWWNVSTNSSYSPYIDSIIWAGWSAPAKGLDKFLDAAEFVHSLFPDQIFYVFILSTNTEYHYDCLRRMNKSTYVRYSINSNALYEAIVNCKLLVVTEQWENPGPVIVSEAIVLGAKVISTDIGGIPELINSQTKPDHKTLYKDIYKCITV